MIELIERLLPKLPVYDSDATGAKSYPYLLILSTFQDQGRESDYGCGDSESAVIVRAVGVTPEQARKALMYARSQLAGLNTSDGRVNWQARFDGCPRPAQVDRVVTVEDSNSHPVFIDDEYTFYRQEVHR